MTVADVISIASDLGVIGLLLLIVFGGAKKVWIWYWQHAERIADLEKQLKEAKEDAREWRMMALNATDIGKRVVTVAEKSVQ